MPAMSAFIGSVVMALLLQGPANLQVGEGTKIPPATVIPKGTTIPIELITRISTKTVKEGDGVYGRTVFPITVNNRIVIPVGSSVKGKITQVQRPGRVKGKAGLALSFQDLILPNGSTIPLFASLAGSSDAKTTHEGKLEGESSKGADAATVGKVATVPTIVGASAGGAKGAGIGAGVGASAGLAAVLLTRGKDMVLNRGTTLEIVLDRPLEP